MAESGPLTASPPGIPVAPTGAWRLWPWLLGLVAFWIAGALLLPVVQDESYYATWGRFPALGYFDHPPLVALLTQTERLALGHGFALRLGGLLTAVLTTFAALRFFRLVGLSSRRTLWTALLLANFNVMGLIFGFITTPDTGLMLAWALALGEAAAALQGNERRWLSAGAATGLGLLSKYTMLLIGPVFLWALIVATRRGPTRGLRSPWPYLGGVIALAVFLPNLWWNARNDWVTFHFQMRHGLAMERSDMNLVGGLPRAETPPPVDSPEAAIAAPFIAMTQIEATEERAPRVYDAPLKALNRYVGYYGSQVALWGGLLVPLAVAWRRRRERAAGSASIDPAAAALVDAAALTPLVVFGLFSLGAKVEANWSAMYIFGAAAWLAPRLATLPPPLLRRWALVNVALGCLALAHVQFGLFPVRPHRDRLLYETHGYPELATYLQRLDGPVFAESFQMVAMMRFLAPAFDVHQWPGITRDSEFVRPTQLTPAVRERLERHGSFWLVETLLPPPRLPGFVPVEMVQLRDCKGQELQVISSLAARDFQDERCKTPIHTWYLIRYDPTQGLD